MNIVDSVIIGVSLVSILIVVIIITRSFKRVDKEIIEDFQNNDSKKQKRFITKVKQSGIFFLEWFIGKLKQGIQKIHFWALKEKKKSKSVLVKARDELVIKQEKHAVSKKVGTKTENKRKKQINKTLDEGSILEKISLQESDVIMDSAVQGNKSNQNKDSFIKGLFKGRASKKKSVDIKQSRDSSSEKWSLGSAPAVQEEDDISNNVDHKKHNVSITEDDVLGVDRQILEKKILQKIDKDPVNINNYHELGALYIKMKKYDDAMEVFGYILNVVPDDLEAKRRQDKIKLLKESKM